MSWQGRLALTITGLEEPDIVVVRGVEAKARFEVLGCVKSAEKPMKDRDYDLVDPSQNHFKVLISQKPPESAMGQAGHQRALLWERVFCPHP